MHTIFRYIQIVGIGLATVVCACIGTVLLPLGQSYALYTGAQLWSRMLFWICGVTMHVDLPSELDWSKPRIYVANHQSHIDTPVLFYALPIALFFIAKKELKHIPFLGWYMQLVGMVFIDRSDKEKAARSLEQAAEQIRKGKNILSFPEGTRSIDGTLGLFKRGSFKMAIHHQLEIVPVGIVGTNRIIPAQTFEIHPGNVHVVVGEAIDPSLWEDADNLAAYTQQKVAELQAIGEAKMANTAIEETVI